MLRLDNPLTLNEAAIHAPNLCNRFDRRDLDAIADVAASGYKTDKDSRAIWEKRNEAGMNLALQVAEAKNFPWAGCSNVKFPLVTIAGLQFHARAYPAIINGGQLVSSQVFGEDPDGGKAARARRISDHMSWQLSQQDKAWEEQEDRGLLNLPIVGCNFKKSYRNASYGHNVSELVLAKNLVVDYWTKSMDTCPRATHLISMSRNDIRERVLTEVFRDVLTEGWYQGTPQQVTTTQRIQQDNRQGVTPPLVDSTTEFIIGEQHTYLDLDGDGYEEPYTITFEVASGALLRIVTRFNSEEDIRRVSSGTRKGQIVRIKPTQHFTKKELIPSPDGGFYGVGFGVLLGPLNESVNTILNQLIDAGTMATTAGGFLAKGAKIRGGQYTFAPLEWKRVDSTGEDLQKSIYPLPVREPSAVLFQLLGLLVNYTNRVSGANDMMVGENPGQNTPAETSRTMVEMGSKIYSAIFKRIWRATEEEFHKLYELNGQYMTDQPEVGGATREDYIGAPDVVPAADPNITSDALLMQQATAVKQAAMTTPGYNRDEVEKRWLRSMKVSSIDSIFPGTAGTEPPKDPKITIAEMKLQAQQAELQAAQQRFIVESMEERRLNNAKIVELFAKAREAEANATSEASYAEVAKINAMISATQADNARLESRINTLLKAAELELREKEVVRANTD